MPLRIIWLGLLLPRNEHESSTFSRDCHMELPMLENVPSIAGRLLRGARAGFDEIATNSGRLADVPQIIDLRGTGFRDGGSLPADHTADGAGRSPGLTWRGVPAGTRSVVLLVEDADSPTPEPLVHAIAWGLPNGDGALAIGALSDHDDRATGRTSYFKTGWLPPDPPTGHGSHRYVFQLFALDTSVEFDGPPGRGALLEVIDGHVIAKGVLVGQYERPAKAGRKRALTIAGLAVAATLGVVALARGRSRADTPDGTGRPRTLFRNRQRG